jgi:hypothetical protein
MAVPGVALPAEGATIGGQAGLFPSVTESPVSSPPAANNPFAPLPSAGEFPPAELRPFAETTASGLDPTGSSANVNPYAAPPGVSYAPQIYFGGPRPGLPWENEPQTLKCWFRTTGMIVGSPTYAFSIMRQTGGLGSPMLFSIYGMGLPVLVGLGIALPIGLLIAVSAGGQDAAKAAGGILIIAVAAVIFAAMYVVLCSTICALITAAIHHVLLMMVGGARQGYETTFRVFCYTQGALFWCVLIPIPYINFFIMGIWSLIVTIIGYSRGHEITGAKAALAIFLPVIVCFGLIFAAGIVGALMSLLQN